MLLTYLLPNEFYMFICKHDNFNVLNKLSLKHENASASEIVNDFIIENNEYFLWLKKYLKRNTQVYQYINPTDFSKMFLLGNDYCVKFKVAFDIVHGSCKNEHKNTYFICEILIKQQVLETSEAVHNMSTKTITVVYSYS